MKPAKILVSLVNLSLFLSPMLQAAPQILQQTQNIQPETAAGTTNNQKSQTPGDPTAEFMTSSSLSAAETSPFLGVEEGATVSGIVEIRPNQKQLPGIRKVAYYLNGSKSGKVYQSPFIWGGVSGNGSAGFDTRTLADGDYKLDMTYTDSTGDHSAIINFKVNNADANTLPTVTPVPASGRTLGGKTFPAGTSFSDVDQAGNFSFLADDQTLYVVDSSDSSNTQLLSAVNFDNTLLDILTSPAGNGVFALEKGEVINGDSRDRLWFINVSDPSHPTKELKANVRNAKNLTLSSQGDRILAFYPSQGENFIVDCNANGSGTCTTNFYNLYASTDFIHTYQNWIVSADEDGNLVKLNFNDVSGTPTPAPIVDLIGKDNYVFVSLENGTTQVYDINQADTGEMGNGTLPVVNTIDPQGNDPISNFIFENKLIVLDSTGLIETFDISNPLNVTRIDSVAMPGTRSVDYDGTNFYAVTEREYRIIGPAASTPPPPAGDSRVLGVSEGQTVSGVVNIRPNPDQISGIRKAAYYLNGMKSGKVYQSPFLWGGVSGNGTAGFDTRTLANGNYTLDIVYTDATGDHTITVHFTVNN